MHSRLSFVYPLTIKYPQQQSDISLIGIIENYFTMTHLLQSLYRNTQIYLINVNVHCNSEHQIRYQLISEMVMYVTSIVKQSITFADIIYSCFQWHYM